MTTLYTTNAVYIDQQMASKWIMLKSRLFVCTSTCNSDLSWSRLVISTASWQFSIALKRQLVARSFNIDWTSPCSNINSSLWHAPTFAFSTNRCRKFNSKVVSNKTQQAINVPTALLFLWRACAILPCQIPPSTEEASRVHHYVG